MAELFVAYADLQLESYRNMIFIGAALGLLNVVPKLFPEPAEEKRTVV
jgi:Pyruvate/2-oxoacid:ferredoxin oxidoreductase gamma subunit